MVFVSLTFYPDGRWCGTVGSEILHSRPYAAHRLKFPGEPEFQLVVKHYGMMETDESHQARKWHPNLELHDFLETHPDSTPENPMVRVKPWLEEFAPKIIEAPCSAPDVGPFVAANGKDALPQNARAWITLNHPELAAEHGLDEGITLENMLAVEKKRVLVHHHQCRKADLARRIAERDAAADRAEREAEAREAEKAHHEKLAAEERAERDAHHAARAARLAQPAQHPDGETA